MFNYTLLFVKVYYIGSIYLVG